jgi:signal peptidase II
MKHYKLLYITAAIIVLDQVTKFLVKSSMHLNESIPIISNYLRLTYIENTGMAFGIQFGENIFFTIFAIIASIMIFVYLLKMKGEHWIARLAVAIILGGAIGNLTDRIIRGGVVDFIDCEFFDIHIPAFKLLFINFPGYGLDRWPVYNIADAAVTVGMVLLLIFVLWYDKKEDEISPRNDSQEEMIR